MEFRVGPDGATQDLRIIDADPAGLFEHSALRFVAGLRYAPSDVTVVPTDQPLRRYMVKFELRGQS